MDQSRGSITSIIRIVNTGVFLKVGNVLQRIKVTFNLKAWPHSVGLHIPESSVDWLPVVFSVSVFRQQRLSEGLFVCVTERLRGAESAA